MSQRRITEVILGIILACSLFFGGTVHALVPHEHSDHHNVGESSMWQSLHASLRHEDKKALPIFNLLTMVGIVCVLTFSIRVQRREEYADAFQNALRRGILPHRKFG